MQLPKYVKKKRVKLKVCREPGCGREFLGHPIAKYCQLHKDLKNRTRRPKYYESVDKKNFVFNHGFSDVTEIQRICEVPNCNRAYMLKIYPKQKVYPKFCEEHRNEYKRHYFKQLNV